MNFKFKTLLAAGVAAASLLTAACARRTAAAPLAAVVPAPARIALGTGYGPAVSLTDPLYPRSSRVEFRQIAGAPETYTLDITADSVLIGVTDDKSRARATATLSQLAAANNGRLPQVSIQDSPRWQHRGLMIDCSRHFWTVEQLETLIQAAWLLKLNVVHLHLTDSQGWRLYMDKHPDVAVKGTYYYDFPDRSGRYYTPEQLRDLVAYAAARGIDIIPEVDMPGHCLALLAARPDLSCNGGEFEAYQDEREQSARKRMGENMLCVGNEATYDFVADVIDQLVDIFPSQYIHMGGDEVSTLVWAKCPKCRALYDREGMTDLHSLQDHFTRRVGEMVAARGRTMVGWEEINERGAAAPGSLLTIWQGKPGEVLDKAVERGLDAVMCPKDPCYFDYGYTRNPSRKVYDWDPTCGRSDSLTLSRIRGGQACLWTEFVPDERLMHEMYFPRLCALAERLWSPAAQTDYDDYLRRMAVLKPQLEAMGVRVFGGERPGEGWFDPKTRNAADAVTPVPARVETNMYHIKGYEPAYAFDGDTTTYYMSPYSHLVNDSLTVRFERPTEVGGVRVLADRGVDGLGDGAVLLVSEDGSGFTPVAEADAEGQMQVVCDRPRTLRAVQLRLTKTKVSRLVVREIMLLPPQ